MPLINELQTGTCENIFAGRCPFGAVRSKVICEYDNHSTPITKPSLVRPRPITKPSLVRQPTVTPNLFQSILDLVGLPQLCQISFCTLKPNFPWLYFTHSWSMLCKSWQAKFLISSIRSQPSSCRSITSHMRSAVSWSAALQSWAASSLGLKFDSPFYAVRALPL